MDSASLELTPRLMTLPEGKAAGYGPVPRAPPQAGGLGPSRGRAGPAAAQAPREGEWAFAARPTQTLALTRARSTTARDGPMPPDSWIDQQDSGTLVTRTCFETRLTPRLHVEVVLFSGLAQHAQQTVVWRQWHNRFKSRSLCPIALATLPGLSSVPRAQLSGTVA